MLTEAGVIKMNIDTDTQWAFWDGMRAYEVCVCVSCVCVAVYTNVRAFNSMTWSAGRRLISAWIYEVCAREGYVSMWMSVYRSYTH